MDGTACQVSPRNKLNLLIYDSERFYVHTNYADSLYVKQTDGTAIFSTVSLTRTGWEPLPFTTLPAYKDGKRIFQGADHGHEYKDNPNDMRLIFVDYAEL